MGQLDKPLFERGKETHSPARVAKIGDAATMAEPKVSKDARENLILTGGLEEPNDEQKDAESLALAGSTQGEAAQDTARPRGQECPGLVWVGRRRGLYDESAMQHTSC